MSDFVSSRRPSPLGGRRPTRAELPAFATDDPHPLDDVLPTGPGSVRMLIVGINPGLWTAAVNAPFAYPGNRFWPSLHRAGLTDRVVDATCGLSAADEEMLLTCGIGITNIVGRATARADQLSRQELRDGAAALADRVARIRPGLVAISGITAFRTGFARPKAIIGIQDTCGIDGWPADVPLHVVPQPSGLNAHYQIDDLARIWRVTWASIDG